MFSNYCCSISQLCPNLCDPMDCSMPGLPVLHCLLEFAQTHIHWNSDAIQPSHPLSSPPPAFHFFRHQDLFQWADFSHQVAKILELQHQRPVNIQGWFPLELTGLFAVQGSLKSLLQYHSWKASVLQCSAFFMAQPSHPYMTTGKTIALTRQMFVSKVMSLVFKALSWIFIAFLPRSKHRNFMATVTICSDFGAQENKISHVSTASPSICNEVMGLDAVILVFWMLSFVPAFSLSCFTFNKRLFSSSSLSTIRVVSSAYLRLLIAIMKKDICKGKHTSLGNLQVGIRTLRISLCKTVTIKISFSTFCPRISLGPYHFCPLLCPSSHENFRWKDL